MSLPSFPEKDSTPSREEVINQIISSVAMEELGLSHIINAEGEKLQYAMGTISGATGPETPATIEDLLALNRSVQDTLSGTMQNQLFLNSKLKTALSASVMYGPTGATGSTGAVGTILDSYETLDELRKEHLTGEQGDAYLVDGKLYVWKEGATDWELVGDLTGPPGTGTTIKGSYDSKDDFDKNPPPGSLDDTYLVEGEIYLWDDDNKSWYSGGSLRGEKGDKGDQGEPGTPLNQGDTLFDILDSDGNKIAMGYENELSFESDTLEISVEAGPNIKIDIPHPTSHTIIPFASVEAPLTYSNNGEPSRVSLLGFGYGDSRNFANYSIVIDPSDQTFSLTGNSNKQLAFSLPFNMILKSIHITVGNYGEFSPSGEVIPYVQLFKADKGTNSFTPIIGANATPVTGIGPGVNISPDTMLYASNDTLNVALDAGDRIAIGAMMRIRNDTERGEKTYWLYFTGGIGMVYNPDPTPIP